MFRKMWKPSHLFNISSVLLICFVCLPFLFSSETNGQNLDGTRRPNIVILMSDDQDLMLGSMEVMQYTKDRIISQGATFGNAFTTSPICCPSRSSFLTGHILLANGTKRLDPGLYSHNHNVLTNNDNCSSPLWRRTHETRTFATFLNSSGYSTSYFGKYLNEYNGSYIPPGWQYWMGLLKNTKYYNYTLRHNDRKEQHRDDYHKDYLTDLIVNRSMEYFRRNKQENPDKPIVSFLSFPAPHGVEDGAPQYQHLYDNVTSHITPSFDYAPNPDKHWIVSQVEGPMDETQHLFSAKLQQKRLQTLRSVDDGIEKFVNMLEEMGELDNTYLLYTSDHGFHIGQFGLPRGKSMPYDFDIRVPFYLRGPGIPAGLKINDIVLNIDIAPTILGIAGVDIPEWMDGRNFMPLIKNRSSVSPPWRHAFLVERGKIPYTRIHLAKPSVPSKDEATAKICKEGSFGHPCVRGQIWTCAPEEGVLKIRKCNKYKRPIRSTKRRKCPCSKKVMIKGLSPKCQRHISLAIRGKRRFFRLYIEPTRTSQGEEFLRQGSTRAKNMQTRVHVGSAMPVMGNRTGSTGNWDLSLTSQCWITMPNSVLKCSFDSGPKVPKLQYWRAAIQAEKTKLKVMKIINGCIASQKKRKVKCKCHYNPKKVVKPTTRSRSHNNTSNYHPKKLIVKWLRDARNVRLEEFRQKRLELDERKRVHHEKKEKIAKRGQNGTTSKSCSTQGVSCFRLTKDKWVTPPRWNGENRCYCTNANNNTYWCIRIINETSNLLYCEFITGFVEYYNLTEDPHQLWNTYTELSPATHTALNAELARLRICKGFAACHGPPAPTTDPVFDSSSLIEVETPRPVFDLNHVEPVLETSTRTTALSLPTNYRPSAGNHKVPSNKQNQETGHRNLSPVHRRRVRFRHKQARGRVLCNRKRSPRERRLCKKKMTRQRRRS